MKNIKLVTKLSLAIALMATSMTSISAVDENQEDKQVQKQETVYAFLDENGTFKNATVSEWLHSDNGFNNVEDTSTLKDIKNLKGDETPTINGNTLTWNSDNDDIYYQGTSDTQLPINMEVSYYFNGSKVDINDVIGESGKLEIHIKLVNSLETTQTINGVKKHISTLFPCLILTDLKDDIFKDVKADDAIVVNEAKNQVVSFVTVSGASQMLNDSDIDALDDIKDKLKDEFIISANVENLEMPSIFMAVSGMVEIDHDDINVSDLDELKDGLNDLQDAFNEILDGSDDLYDAVSDDLTSGVADLDKGASDLKDGAKKLADGSSKLQNEGIAQIKDGTSSLLTGSKSLQSGSEQLSSGLQQVSGSAGEKDNDNANSKLVQQGVTTISDTLSNILNLLKAIDNACKTSDTNDLTTKTQEIQESLDSLKALLSSLSSASQSLTTLQQQLTYNTYKNGLISTLVSKGYDQESATNLANDILTNQSIINTLSARKSALEARINQLSGASYDDNTIEDSTIIYNEDGTVDQANIQDSQDIVNDTNDLENNEIVNDDLDNANNTSEQVEDNQSVSDEIIVPQNSEQIQDNQESDITLTSYKNDYSYILLDNDNSSSQSELEFLQQEYQGVCSALATLQSYSTILDSYTQGYFQTIQETMSKDTTFNSLNDLTNGSNNLVSGLSTLLDSGALDSGTLATLMLNIDKLQAACASLTNEKTGISAYTNGVIQINNNMATLVAGSKTLTEGISSLNDGITTIYSSTNELVKGSKQLYDGTNDLKDGTSELKDGVADLNDGIIELRDGLYQFNEEGIQELSTKVNDAINDLDDVLDTVNATLDQSIEYNNYGGSNENMESSVKFIMKTQEVKISEDKQNTNDNTTDTVSSSTTLWQRIVNLFK